MKKHTISSIIRRIALLTTMTALCVGMPAHAIVPSEADEDTEPAEIIEVTPTPTPTPAISYEPLPEGTSQPFSIAGNGEVLDDIEDGDKEFYTITTQNNNQFFIVVDKARASENVYMLARVDETDIAGFNTGSYALIGVAALVFVAGAYYFKVYKPRHEEGEYDDEGMEFDDSEDETDDGE